MNLSIHAKLSKGGESAHRRSKGGESAHRRINQVPTRRCRTYPHTPRCPKAEKAPTGAKQAARGSLFRDCVFYENECSRTQFIFPNLGEPRNTQYVVVARPYLYIIQFISSYFKSQNAVLSYLYRQNDDLHNIFKLSLCIIFLILLVLELL